MALVGLEVWSDSDKCPITQDPFNTLHEFLDWRKVKLLPQKPHDNAQLIRWTFNLLVETEANKLSLIRENTSLNISSNIFYCVYE